MRGLAGAWVLALGAAAQAQPWRVCVPDAAFPPYLNNDVQRLGLSERLMVEAGQRAGLTIQFERLPYQRCLALVREASLQALVAPAPTAEAAGLALPRKAGGELEAQQYLIRMNLVWLRRAGAAWTWDGKQLQGLPSGSTVLMRSGVQMGVAALQGLGLQVDQSARDASQMLRMLLSGRAAAAVMLVAEFDGVAATPEFQGIEQLPVPLQTPTYFVAVAPKLYALHAAQVDLWWRAIGALRDTPAFSPAAAR